MANIPDARSRILNVATEIFAEKSFEGSRIDDIAKMANVPKSLIYYHFKSKENILETLIKEFLEKYKKLLRGSENDKENIEWEGLVGELNSDYTKFINSNVDVIRIILVESLKKTVSVPPVFKVVEELIENDDEKMKSDISYNKEERLIAEFFTGLIPLYSFLCFQEKWCEHFKIDSKNFSNMVMSLIIETHGCYHNNHTEQ